MERKFFEVIKKIGLAVTSITLTVVVIGGILAVIKMTGSVNERIEPAQITFASFEKALLETESNTSNEISKNDEDALKKVLQESFNKIVLNINTYAIEHNAKEGTVNEKAFTSYLNERMVNFDNDLRTTYLNQLSIATDELLNSSKSANMQPILWTKFLAWFDAQFQKNLIKEQDRIKAETIETASDKITGLILLASVGIALSIFMFFTMILILLHIESNTRTKELEPDQM